MKGYVMQTMLRTIACIVMISVAVSWTYAEFSEPEDAIAYRQSVMVLVARHFKHIAAVVPGKADHDKHAFAA
jgi:formate/nitrite transporter FocA (FNT family)